MNYEQLLQIRKYDPTKAPKIEQVIFTIQDKNVGSLQNIVTFSGLPKAGKSRFISALISSGLTGQEIFTMKLRLYGNNYKLIHIDTEQSEYDYYKMMNYIKQSSGLDQLPAHFLSYNMREDEPKTIVGALEHLAKTETNIGCVIIDGILDLLMSYNDETESKRLVNILKKLSKNGNCLIINILHTGKTTGNTLGHFGGMSDRASQSTIEIKKNEIEKTTFYNLAVKQSRSCDPNNIFPIDIFYNVHTREWEMSGNDNSNERVKNKMPGQIHPDIHKTTLQRIFLTRGHELKYNELVDEIRQFYNSSMKWGKEAVMHFLALQILYKNDKGLYTIHQQLKIKA